MKKIVIVLAILASGLSVSAQTYISKTGKVRFYSDAALEKIEAISTSFATGFSAKENKLIIKIPIKSFQFKDPLMMEHFNENYLESGKYPDAKFVGNVNETIDLSKDGSYPVTVTGKLEIHGVSIPRTINGTIKKQGNSLIFISKFMVKLADHKIEIPKIVFNKIAEEVEVNYETELKPAGK